ncbi:hypothetical protein AAY473_015676 [Plecturocebus cupreus]
MRKTSGFGSGEGGRPRGLVSSLKEVGAGAGRESEHSTSSESERCDAHDDRQAPESYLLGPDAQTAADPSFEEAWRGQQTQEKTTSESVSQKCDSHLSGGDGQREKSTIKEQEA